VRARFDLRIIPLREQCYECFRPQSHCFCASIPQISNRTDVLILQHVGERFHPFNTARIVHRALGQCQLVVDHNQHFGTRQLPISSDAGLLFPADGARRLDEIPEHERPSQLVIIDGTWHQAKTIVRDAPQIQSLRCFRLAPTSPGQYRIRREPNAFSLSTLEATVAALAALEPETQGLDQLMAAFHRMVETQLGHPDSYRARRKKTTQGLHKRHLPHALRGNLEHLVVAYGEAMPGVDGSRNADGGPVTWYAERLSTGERFSCCLERRGKLSPDESQHMRLDPSELATMLSDSHFGRAWEQFFQARNDVLIVYHQRTHHLLQQIVAQPTRCVVLKSLFRKWHEGFQSLEELLAQEKIAIPPVIGSRSKERLAMAVALVQQTNARHGTK
jgi:DTW domain-containing protein YfiP